MVQPFIRIAGRRINLTHLDTCTFPKAKVFKRDIITYYRTIARVMLRHIHDRPLTLQVFSGDIGSGGSLMRDRPTSFPQWIPSASIPSPEGPSSGKKGSINAVLASASADLIYLANQGMVALHMGLSRVDRIHYPDRLIFDLDPSGNDFSSVPQVAVRLKRSIESLGLTPYIQTTGSRGAQISVPIKRTSTFDEVRDFARVLARDVASSFPDIATVDADEARRGKRVYINCSRNAYGQTVIVPYSLRAMEGAPVATPLDWKELGATDLSAEKYDIQSILRRLAQKSDPWDGMNRRASSLQKARERLEATVQSGAA